MSKRTRDAAQRPAAAGSTAAPGDPLAVDAFAGPDDATAVPMGDEAQAPSAYAAQPHRLLSGRYLLEELIAQGGMAAVWRAHDEILARTVAVKVLHDHLAADHDFKERFRREAIAAARLSHGNVVGLYDTGTDDSTTYLVMEFIDGVTLKDLIVRGGQLPLGQACDIAAHVARALDYAHQRGLVHRDVKPANILIADDGTVKVADFGIAKADHGHDLTRTGMVLGTAAYVAPEQIRGQEVDGKADQYALAVVLHEALTGRQPFQADSPVATAALRLEHDAAPVRATRPDAPRGLDHVLDRAMARDPQERYPTTLAFAEALAPYLDGDADATAALVAAQEREWSPASDAGITAHVPSTSPRRGTTSELEVVDDDPRGRERRRIGLVLVLLIVAALATGAGVLSGVIQPPEGFPTLTAREQAEEPDEQAGPAAPAAPVGLEPGMLSAFDPVDVSGFPGGDGRENDDQLPNLVDGNPQTAWYTERYNTPNLGGLKPGVGFVVDLGQPHRIDEVVLATATPGVMVEVRAADEPAPDADAWQRLGELVPTTQGPEAIVPDRVSSARYLLVYITQAAPADDGDRNRAGFSELEVTGAPQ